MRQIRQDFVRYGSLPIILDGILTNLADPEEALKKMSDMIKSETENNFQVQITFYRVSQNKCSHVLTNPNNMGTFFLGHPVCKVK